TWEGHAWQYLGALRFGESTSLFFLGRKSRYTETSEPIATFRWMWERLKNNQPLEYSINANPTILSGGAKLLHEGRCGRCGRRLTVPESIESGYGPECRS